MVETKAKTSNNSVLYELPENIMEHDEVEDQVQEQVLIGQGRNEKKKTEDPSNAGCCTGGEQKGKCVIF